MSDEVSKISTHTQERAVAGSAPLPPLAPVAKKLSLIPRAPAVSWMALGWLWAVYAMNATGRELINRVAPAIIKEFNISSDTWGLYVTITTLAISALAIPGASWADKGGHGWMRKRRHVFIAFGYTIFAVLTGFHWLTAALGVFIAFQIVKNMFGGIGESIEVTSVAEWWPDEYRGFAQGAHHSGYPWGSLIGGWIASGILAVYGPSNWRLTFLLIPLLMIPIFSGYWIFANSKHFKRYQTRTRTMGMKPMVEEEDMVGTRAPQGALGRAIRNPNILVAAFASFVGILVYAGMGYWLAPYLVFVGKYSIAAAAGWSTIFAITGGIGQIVWGTLSDKIGRKVTLLITFAWLAVGVFLMQYTTSGIGWLIGIQLFAGCATNAIFPVLYSLTTDSSEKGAAGVGNSVTLFGLYIGGVAPWILGLLIRSGGGWNARPGFVYGLWFLVGMLAVAWLVILFFSRETRGPWRGKDLSLVSMKSCNVDPDTIR
jgi:MFS family permease